MESVPVFFCICPDITPILFSIYKIMNVLQNGI